MKTLFNKYVRNSRILFIVINFIFLALLVFVCTLYFDVGAKKLSQYYVSNEDFQKIAADRKRMKEHPVIKIRANSYDLVKDELHGNWIYSLIEGNSSAKNPKMKFYTVNPEIKIATSNKQINNADLSRDVPLKFIAYDDDSYYLFNITCTTLPVMSLNNGEVYLFDNRKNAGRRVFHSYAEYHPRGRNSLNSHKKNLSLKLKTYSPGNNKRPYKTSLLGMPQRSHWHLYSIYLDPTKIRNVLSARLWKESCAKNNLFNLDNGYEYKYIELFNEGEYDGLYALGYPVIPKQLGIDIKKDEYMYKKSTFDNPFLVIRGRNKHDISYVNKYIHEFYTKENNSEKLYEDTDIVNAVDYWLFVNFIQSIDTENFETHSFHNLFISRKKYKNGYKFMFTPWDLDQTWGFQNLSSGYNLVITVSPVYKLISMKDEKIFKIIEERYQYLRRNYWNEEFINSLIDEYENNLVDSGAFLRDFKKWPHFGSQPFKFADFRYFVKLRLQSMDKYIYNLIKTKSP